MAVKLKVVLAPEATLVVRGTLFIPQVELLDGLRDINLMLPANQLCVPVFRIVIETLYDCPASMFVGTDWLTNAEFNGVLRVAPKLAHMLPTSSITTIP